ncbi:MAG: Ig-like domain-containing protein, partial [Verrucomicrobiota bacterium]
GDYTRYGGVDGDPLPTDDFTLGLWVQGADPAYTNTRSSLLATNGDSNDSLWIGAIGGNWGISLGWPGADGGTVLATFAITPSTPQHIEVTREAGEYSVYLDGMRVAGPTAAGGFNWNSFHVGINSGGWSHYRGLFGDVLLTDVVARSPEAKIKVFGTHVAGSSAVIGTPVGNSAAIAWTVPYGTTPGDIATLAPTFTLSSGASCTTALDGGTTIHSGDMFDFTSPVHYVVKASDYDAVSNPNYTDYTVTVTVAPPFNFYTGLAAWFDASQLTGLSDGDQVDTWADLSGAHTATKNQGSMRFSTNQINTTLPTVQFRDNACANLSGSMFAKEQYIVFRLPQSGDWGTVLGSQTRSGYLMNPTGYFWDQNYPSAVRQNGGAPLSPNFQLSNIGDFMVLKITGNSNDTSVRSGWALGRQEGWAAPGMDVAEIIAFDHILSTADEDTVGGYLESKYGLDTAYPAFNLPVPYGLKATPGDTQATLAWPAFPGASGYNLRRSITPGGPYTVVIPVAGTTCTDTELTNGTTYYYVVTATTGTGETNNSAEVSVIPSAVDAGLSSVVAYLPEVWSDGSSASTITVTLRNGGGIPAAGKLVTLTHTSGTGSPVLNTTTGTTDGNGMATFTVTSNSAGVEGFTATATIATGEVAITQTGMVTFKTKPADLATYVPTNLPAGGVVTVVGTWNAALNNWSAWQNWEANSYDVFGNKVLGVKGGARGAMYLQDNLPSAMSYFDSGFEVTYIGSSDWPPGRAAWAELYTWDNDVGNNPWPNGRKGFIVNQDGGPGTVRTYAMTGDGSGPSQDWPTTNTVGLHTMTLLRLANGDVQAYVDGVLRSTMAGTADPAYPLTRLGFGCEYTGNSYMPKGTIVEQVKAFTVSYPVGAPDAATSTVVASPATMTANGTDTSTVTVTLKDADGNRVAGKEVTLSYTGSGAVTYSPSATQTTGVAGTAVFTVQPTSTTPGIYEFTATVTSPAVVITQKAILNTTLAISTAVLDISGVGTGEEILNTGTLVEANHFGSSITELTVNGVVFGTSNAHLTKSPGGGSTNSDAQNLVTSLTDDNDYGKLMRSYIWGGDQTATLNIPGLTVGKTYRLQWITCSPRGGNISVEGSASVPLAPTTKPDSNYPRVFAFTWVATDTTANVLVTRQPGEYDTDNEILFNAYALHDMGGGAAPGYAGWAKDHVNSQAANLDFNNDGVQNGIAYFMNETGRA